MELTLSHDQGADLVRALTGRPDYHTLAELADRRHDEMSWRSTFAWLLASRGEDLTDEYAADVGWELEAELPFPLIHSEFHILARSAPWQHDEWHTDRYEWAVNGRRQLRRCEVCDRFVLLARWVDNDSTRICEACEEDCYSCQNCGMRWVRENAADECCYSEDYDDDDGDGCSCPDCNGGSGNVHGYSYKPAPLMHGTGTYRFGVEIEIEANGGGGSVRDVIAALSDESERDFYLKDDSSIDNGVELVTHPRSLTSWQEYEGQLGAILADAARAGGRAWDAPRCGLHVHVSRTAFLNESHLYAFTLLIEDNVSPLTRFAGRHSERWASFDKDKRGVDLEDAVKPGVEGDRYMAVNLNNPDTVELRFFRPSLKVRSVLAAVELIDALVTFTRPMTTAGILMGQMSWDRFRSFLEDNEDTYGAAVEVMARRVKITSAPIDPSTVEE